MFKANDSNIAVEQGLFTQYRSEKYHSEENNMCIHAIFFTIVRH